MEVGISLSAEFSTSVSDAIWAEDAGLSGFAMPDHLLRSHAIDALKAPFAPAPEPFVQLAAIARETRHIQLATLCTPVTFRHPSSLLKSTIEMSVVSGGRFTLGLGTGYRQEEHDIFGVPFPPIDERFEQLEETLGYLRAGLSTPNPGFGGGRMSLAAHPVAPQPDRVRLLVGGAGPRRTPGVAGRHADEYNLMADTDDAIKERIETARAAWDSAGRTGTFVLSIAGVLVTGRTDTEVKESARRQAKRVGASPGQFLDEHLARHSFIGTHGEVTQRLARLAHLGVSRCYFVFEGEVDRCGVRAVHELLSMTLFNSAIRHN